MIKLIVDQKKTLTLACVCSCRTDFFIIKKGSIVNFALGGCMVQPFGSMPRLLSSCRARSLNQLLSVMLSESAAEFSCSLNSGCMRIWNAGDCPPVFGVRSFTLDIVHTFSSNEFHKVCTLYHVYALKQTPSKGATNTRRGLTTNDNYTIEAAMKNNTTAPQRFTFLFLAVMRANTQAHPHREQISATSEREARSLLAGRFVLIFAGRQPVREVVNA